MLSKYIIIKILKNYYNLLLAIFVYIVDVLVNPNNITRYL